MKAINVTSGKELANFLIVADNLLSRWKGLLGKEALSTDAGLLITPCIGIHTFFMRHSIDLIFLNSEYRVIAVKEALPPNSITGLYTKACCALELSSGKIFATTTKPGHLITFS